MCVGGGGRRSATGLSVCESFSLLSMDKEHFKNNNNKNILEISRRERNASERKTKRENGR